jgi:hypothetical protein
MDSASTALSEEELNFFLIVLVQQIHDVDLQWMRNLTARLF